LGGWKFKNIITLERKISSQYECPFLSYNFFKYLTLQKYPYLFLEFHKNWYRYYSYYSYFLVKISSQYVLPFFSNIFFKFLAPTYFSNFLKMYWGIAFIIANFCLKFEIHIAFPFWVRIFLNFQPPKNTSNNS
jgi:hypothetical protein